MKNLKWIGKLIQVLHNQSIISLDCTDTALHNENTRIAFDFRNLGILRFVNIRTKLRCKVMCHLAQQPVWISGYHC